jgi:cytochrome c553
VTASARHLFGALLLALLAPTLVSAHEPPPTVPLCALCHGETGPSPFSGVPTIHGLPHGVIENALFNFRYGHRPCRKSACSEDGRCPDMNMCDLAAPMSRSRHRPASPIGTAPSRSRCTGIPTMRNSPHEAARSMRRYCEICHTNSAQIPSMTPACCAASARCTCVRHWRISSRVAAPWAWMPWMRASRLLG